MINHLIELPTSPLQPSQNTTRGHTKRFIQPACNIRCCQDSFYPAGISIWNALPYPQSLVSAGFLEKFKAGIGKYPN
jgi:hypothetical protein